MDCKQKNNIMLDLETLSTDSNAVILVIAAIRFNRKEITEWNPQSCNQSVLTNLDTFYRRIYINSCVELGMDINESTENWWNNLPDDIKYESLVNPDRVRIQQGLYEFSKWVNETNNNKIWGNGSSFDCVILKNAYKNARLKCPWKYWNERDLRTMVDISNIEKHELPQFEEKHNAIYDCYYQIITLAECFKRLNIN